MSQALQFYQSAGNEAFSKMVCQMAPYFATIDPTFVELKPGYAEVRLPFRREVTNHLGSVHAIAMCNAAELVAGTMTDVSIPAGSRWIPKGMTVEYLAKAKTDLRAVADGSSVDFSQPGDVVVPVDVFDTDGQKVFSARITMNVKAG
ncbi:MAG: hotdog fold domain-containing protein [Chitinivorax sp.]